MKTSMLESKAADTIVRTCATVRAGETVVVVTDPTLFDVADKIAAAAYTAQAGPVIAVMTPREWDGQEPPTAVAAAMRAADVVIFPTVKDIAHAVAMKEALQAGARAISMAGCGEDILRDPALEADFVAQRPICDQAADVLTRRPISPPTRTRRDASAAGDGGTRIGHGPPWSGRACWRLGRLPG